MKKIFLTHNSQIGYSAVKEYEDNLDRLNKLSKELSEGIYKKPLTDDELKRLVKEPRAFIKKLRIDLMIDYPFPDAPQSFNYTAMGIDFLGTEIAIGKCSTADYKYEISNGNIITLDSEKERLKATGDVYTRNEKQNEVVKELTVIKDKINGLFQSNELGTLSGKGMFVTKLFSNLLKLKSTTPPEVILNTDAIIQIR